MKSKKYVYFNLKYDTIMTRKGATPCKKNDEKGEKTMKRIYNYYPENTIIDLHFVKVEPLCSSRTGEAVKNQYSIRLGYGLRVYQSYSTRCLMFDMDCKIVTVYPAAFTASKTTSKYAKQFLVDFCGLTDDEAEEVKKIAKTEKFTEEKPLYIEF